MKTEINPISLWVWKKSHSEYWAIQLKHFSKFESKSDVKFPLMNSLLRYRSERLASFDGKAVFLTCWFQAWNVNSPRSENFCFVWRQCRWVDFLKETLHIDLSFIIVLLYARLKDRSFYSFTAWKGAFFHLWEYKSSTYRFQCYFF